MPDKHVDISEAVVLVVDDNKTNLDLMIAYLKRAGYSVRIATNGHLALKQVQHEVPDLILLDVMMPELDGYETCRRLKAKEATSEVPVIFMTALQEIENKMKGFEVGAVDYITKPIDPREVLARVKTHLTLRKTQELVLEQVEALQARNAELEAFDRTVAHDLKNPINAITGYGQFLVDDAETIDRQEMRELSEIIVEQGYHLSRVVESLLLLSAVRKGEIQTYPFDMKPIVHQMQKSLTPMLEKASATVVIQSTNDENEGWPKVIGYPDWLESVWSNYISNAVRYGGDPPHIELGFTLPSESANDEPPHVRFWVRDNGPGIAPEKQDQLFTPFTRLDKLRFKDGHGLGLSIVQRIITKLGGQVGVESQPGAGSTFYFTLPLA